MSRAQLTEAINRALAEDAQCTHETQWAGFCVHCGKHMTSLVPHPVARNGHRPVPEEEEGPCTHECQFAGLCADCGKEIEPNRYPTHDPIFSDNKSKDSISKREEEEGPCTHKITFAGLCADCGMNMKPDRPTARNASFSANKPAESISKKEENGAPCAHKTTFANLCADCGEAVPSPTLTANTPTPQTANRPPAYRSRDWTAAYNDCTNDDDDDGLPDFVPTPHQARTTSPPPSHHTEETSHSTAQAPCVHPTQFAGICLACNTDTRSPGPRSQPPYNTAPIPETIDLRASSRLAGITRDGPPPEGFDTTSLTRAEAREFAELRLGRVIEGLGYEALKESWKGKPNGELHAAMVGDIAKEVLRDVLVDELLGEEGVGRGLRERRGVADGRRGAVDFGRGGKLRTSEGFKIIGDTDDDRYSACTTTQPRRGQE
ncbi:hypothetical protein BU16DRAFT_377569 [Lophium mytilinum]|uniref:Uncharacterized protein n=1 Tax=Lophium mytilinum TaxID=390894 RepID=A0A6A6QWE1_9PEZI|nr:hypothetical protein BU16DRAFT_377569 [Lophium mytilinum]